MRPKVGCGSAPPANPSSKHLCSSGKQLSPFVVFGAKRGSCQVPVALGDRMALGVAHQAGVLVLHSRRLWGGSLCAEPPHPLGLQGKPRV